ncbi:hypothetical protein BY458DRAFT_48086 [Sporodiniella umbellata]|nr:hypothetical protein BY458DRAFT_48086 [Sporodiniella umbellata]
MLIPELLDPNTQLKEIMEEEEQLLSLTYESESEENLGLTDVPEHCLDKSRQKKKPKRLEDTLLRLNEIIHQTVIETDNQSDSDFLFDLMYQAEQLKALSMELLSTERQVRAFRSLEDSVTEQYQLRERAYQQRIEECEQVSRQQTELIDSLVELCHDLEPSQKKKKRRSFMTASSSQSTWDKPQTSTRATSLNSFYVNKTEDPEPLRQRLGQWVGQVRSGNLVHAFDSPLGVKEFIISGTAVVFSVRYQYMFHIHSNIRHLFKLLSTAFWIPDIGVFTCQVSSCTTQFSFLQRKHHCRHCGQVVCHAHSLNKLPLFTSYHPQHSLQWHRVCDSCFTDLILS